MPTNDEQQQIYDPSDLRKYRIELPNLYDDADLDVYEFRLLAHYKRVGACWESTATTAAKCKMSVGKVSEARRTLQDKGFITIEEEPSEYGTIQITVNDVWAQNFEQYAHRSRSEHDRSPHERQRSPHETKKEPIEENTHGEQQVETETPKAKAWKALVDLFVTVSGYHFQKFSDTWDKSPDIRRHDYAYARLLKTNPRKFDFYLQDFAGYDPDRPRTWGDGIPKKATPQAQKPTSGTSWDNMRTLQ